MACPAELGATESADGTRKDLYGNAARRTLPSLARPGPVRAAYRWRSAYRPLRPDAASTSSSVKNVFFNGPLHG
jgi:hypothetical protein